MKSYMLKVLPVLVRFDPAHVAQVLFALSTLPF